MRLKQIMLILSFLFSTSSKSFGEIIVISLGGSSSKSIHTVVNNCARDCGITLSLGSNWLKSKGDARADNDDAKRIRRYINRLSRLNGNDKSELSLLVVGKSAGGVLAWNTFKRHFDDIADFKRIALVMVDPHGSVWDDGIFGTYNALRMLSWQDNWLVDKNIFRVYNIYQHEKGLTGSSFPNRNVYKNIKIADGSVSHKKIPNHKTTRQIIKEALFFVNGTPLSIIVHNLTGKSTCCCNRSGTQEITFHLENMLSSRARVKVFLDDVALSDHNVMENENATLTLPPSRGQKVILKAYCADKIAQKVIDLDFNPPNFSIINVNRHGRAVTLYPDRLRDDGYWNNTDYDVSVKLDDNHPAIKSGTAITFEDLSLGNHRAEMRIKDGCGRWSSPRTIAFKVEEELPSLIFISPGNNAGIRQGSNLVVTIEASDLEGIMRASIYLDRVSDDEFDNTRICYFPGIFGVGRSARKTCNVRADWNLGTHKLIAIAVDNSHNKTSIERVFRIIERR